METTLIINELLRNQQVFKDLLSNLSEDMYLWKPNTEKWCLLEVVCHLLDEEREDFRARTRLILETPNDPLSSIDPVGWVKERNYIQQNFEDKLYQFIIERGRSVDWLISLNNPKWNNIHKHPKFGDMTAKMILSNWLGHDYLHIRQIIKLKFDYLKNITNEILSYAGEW